MAPHKNRLTEFALGHFESKPAFRHCLILIEVEWDLSWPTTCPFRTNSAFEANNDGLSMVLAVPDSL